ncbi:hypothetical protein INR49_020578, partial [Caranx melampygus]
VSARLSRFNTKLGSLTSHCLLPYGYVFFNIQPKGETSPSGINISDTHNNGYRNVRKLLRGHFSLRRASKKVKAQRRRKKSRKGTQTWTGGVGEFVRGWVRGVGRKVELWAGAGPSRAAVKLLAVEGKMESEKKALSGADQDHG